MKGFNMSYTVHCERATIDYDLSRGAEASAVDRAGERTRVIKCDASDGYSQEIEYVLNCAVNNQAPKV
jgi:hypothetical protein